MTKNDDLILEQKRRDIMNKMSELEMMTKKIQQLLGLADPDSDVYTKVFQMLPSYLSFTSEHKILTNDDEDQSATTTRNKQETKMLMTQRNKAWAEFPDDDHFNISRQDYPEDK